MERLAGRSQIGDVALDPVGRTLHREVQYRGYTVDIVRSPGTTFPHRHVGFEVVFVHSGTAVWWVDEWMGVLLPGDVLVFDATRPHSSRPVRGEYVRTTIHLMPDVVDEATSRLLSHWAQMTSRLSLPEGTAQDVFRMIRALRSARSGYTQLRHVRSAISDMMNLMDSRCLLERKTIHPVVDETLEFMIQEADGSETVEELAAKFFVSEGHLYHLFRNRLGCSPQQLLQTIKIERSCAELLRGEPAVEDLAAAAGFATRRGFERAFKRVTGMTVKSFRGRVSSQFWS